LELIYHEEHEDHEGKSGEIFVFSMSPW